MVAKTIMRVYIIYNNVLVLLLNRLALVYSLAIPTNCFR